jgi:hypothetical protein
VETGDERFRFAALVYFGEVEMHVSPPIAILAIIAALVAAAVWLAPPQPEVTEAKVMLPAATYQRLMLLGKEYSGANGRPLTVVEVIEMLANKRTNDNDASASSAGTLAK